MIEKGMNFSVGMNEKEIKEIWRTHSYPDGPNNCRHMTEIGFLQAAQEFGVVIKEE